MKVMKPQIPGILEEILGYTFLEPDLLLQAITHKSFVNENYPGAGSDRMMDYERLEFLGDAVLELKVSELLYVRFPCKPEGELSRMRARIVNAEALARFSDKLGLGGFLRLGRGEARQGGRQRGSLLADSFEALLAALFLDGGVEPIQRLVGELVELELASNWFDYKSKLQERLQGEHGQLPVYELVERCGSDHKPLFGVEVRDTNGRLLGRGRGSSRKAAEQKAAREALQSFG
jgi:ribonuclease-3